MAIYTPRGLKIRLDPELVFTYTTRVRGKYNSAEVLMMVEGLELLPSLFVYTVAIVCFALRLDPLVIAAIIAVSCVAFNLASGALGAFLGPKVLLWMSKYVRETIIFIVLAIDGYFTVGWEGLLYSFAGLVVGIIVNLVFNHLQTRQMMDDFGFPFTKSERLFFKAFVICARKAGVSSSLSISEEEKQSARWYASYTLYQMAFPQLA